MNTVKFKMVLEWKCPKCGLMHHQGGSKLGESEAEEIIENGEDPNHFSTVPDSVWCKKCEIQYLLDDSGVGTYGENDERDY